MKEQVIKRCIMEAFDEATGKNVCMQMTFHGYTEDEVTDTIHEVEKFWQDVKERLRLNDTKKETAAGECC